MKVLEEELLLPICNVDTMLLIFWLFRHVNLKDSDSKL